MIGCGPATIAPAALAPSLHCSLSSSHILVAIGPLRSPFMSLSLPPWLGFGIWALGSGLYRLVTSHWF